MNGTRYWQGGKHELLPNAHWQKQIKSLGGSAQQANDLGNFRPNALTVHLETLAKKASVHLNLSICTAASLAT